jgi:hypothetical protein
LISLKISSTKMSLLGKIKGTSCGFVGSVDLGILTQLIACSLTTMVGI